MPGPPENSRAGEAAACSCRVGAEPATLAWLPGTHSSALTTPTQTSGSPSPSQGPPPSKPWLPHPPTPGSGPGVGTPGLSLATWQPHLLSCCLLGRRTRAPHLGVANEAASLSCLPPWALSPEGGRGWVGQGRARSQTHLVKELVLRQVPDVLGLIRRRETRSDREAWLVVEGHAPGTTAQGLSEPGAPQPQAATATALQWVRLVPSVTRLGWGWGSGRLGVWGRLCRDCPGLRLPLEMKRLRAHEDFFFQ